MTSQPLRERAAIAIQAALISKCASEFKCTTPEEWDQWTEQIARSAVSHADARIARLRETAPSGTSDQNVEKYCDHVWGGRPLECLRCGVVK